MEPREAAGGEGEFHSTKSPACTAGGVGPACRRTVVHSWLAPSGVSMEGQAQDSSQGPVLRVGQAPGQGRSRDSLGEEGGPGPVWREVAAKAAGAGGRKGWG